MTASKAKSDAKASTFAAQDILAQMQQFHAQLYGGWGQMAREQLDRWVEATSQLSTWSQQGTERVEQATDEAGRMFKSTLDYGRKLAEQWHTASVDAARKAVDMVAPH